jgi:uncharacterized membrane protein YhaH (DUF805 family)
MNWYLEALKKYAVFEGRARRKEYWIFTLFNVIIVFLLVFVAVLFLGQEAGSIVNFLYSLAVLIPSIAVGVRRMHDTDHSGWWILLPIVNLVFAVQDSQPGSNRFGQNPKETLDRYVPPPATATMQPQWQQPAPFPAQQAVLFRLAPQLSGLGLPTLDLPTAGNYWLGSRHSGRVQLVIPNQQVSGEHLQITVNPDYSVVVEDLGSTNGTQVAGIGITRGQLQPLHVGQTLRLGHDDVTYTLQRG